MKMNALLFHTLEHILPGPVTVVDAFGWGLEEVGMIQQQLGGERRLTAARRAHDHQAGGCVKPKRLTSFHVPYGRETRQRVLYNAGSPKEETEVRRGKITTARAREYACLALNDLTSFFF